MLKRFKILAPLLAAAAVAACGGGSGGGASNTLTGKVIDGYIKGAKICLDVNSNGQCDSDEPTATTGAGGAYSLSYTGDLAGMHVIAEVPSTAFDEDDNGKTLAEAGKEAFSLFAPAESATAVTPLTTLVSVEMISNPGTSSADAEAAIKATNNITNDLMGHDYVSKKDTNAHDLAKKIVEAVVSAKKELDASADFKSASGTKPELASMKAAVSQVQSGVISKMIAADGKVDTSFDAKNAAKTMITGNLQNIIAQTRSGDGTVVSMADILKEGLIIGQGEETSNVLDDQNNPRYQKDGLKVNYKKINNDLNSFVIDKEYVYTTPFADDGYQIAAGTKGWYKYYDYSVDHYLVNGKWEVMNEKIHSVEGNCAVVSGTANNDNLSKFCGTRKALAGKKVIDFIKDVCLDDDEQAIPGCNVNQAFPEGTFGYDMQVTRLSDQYRIWVNRNGLGFNGPLQTMDDLISYLRGTHTCIGWCSADIQIRSYNPSTKTGRMKWREHGPGDFTEETGFSVIEVNGIKILKYENSKLFRDLENNDDLYGIFAEFKNSDGSMRIERGDFYPKNIRQSVLFNGKTKIGNAKVLDTYTRMRGMPAFPY